MEIYFSACASAKLSNKKVRIQKIGNTAVKGEMQIGTGTEIRTDMS